MHSTTTVAGYGGGKVLFVGSRVLVAAVVLEILGEVVAACLAAAVRLDSFLQKPALQRHPAMLGLHIIGGK